MPAGLFWQRLLEHLLLSAIPTAVGGALAWPASKHFARQLAKIRGPEYPWSPSLILFPWRAILVTLIILFLPFVPIISILGHGVAFYLTGMALASFALGVALLTHAHSAQAEMQPSSTKMVASLRTLAVAVVAVAVPAYDDLGLGAGWMIQAGLVRLGFDLMWAGIGIVALLALIFDLLFGYTQYRKQLAEDSS